VLATGGQNGIELTPLNENQYGCTNTGNCIPAGPDRYNRGATPGQNGASLYDLSWTPVSPCPLPLLRLAAWESELAPTGQLVHRYRLESDLPLTAIELHLQPLATNQASWQETFPPAAEGTLVHLLPAPGTYEMGFFVRLPGGSARLLSRKRLTYESPFQLKGKVLHLQGAETQPFALYDALGRILAEGVLSPNQPLVLDLSPYPAGLYCLRLGAESYPVRLAP